MKKLFSIILILIIVFIIALVWYETPVQLYPDHTKTVQSIEIFDGTHGREMTINDPIVIKYIVEEFQGDYFRRADLALGMGNSFRLTFHYQMGSRKLKLHWFDKVKKGGFFYEPVNGIGYADVFNYLDDLLTWSENGAIGPLPTPPKA